MDKKILIIAVIILFLTGLGLLAYNNLEVYQRRNYISPSREVINNNYYAMEMWLKETGHNVQTGYYFHPELLNYPARKIAIVSSITYDWQDTKPIINWIEQGGFFVIILEIFDDMNDYLSDFLSGFGVKVDNIQRPLSSGNNELINEDLHPDFHRRISFLTDDEDKFFLIKDLNGNIRLLEIPLGNGALTVTGLPIFMYNRYLEKRANAVLSWRLTGARTDQNNRDILFVRFQNRNTSNSLVNSIIERGNLVPVIISAFLLIVAGFWMVIPGFGLVFDEKQNKSRPLKDRFTAEIRFLKKNHSLDYYLDVYEREQKTSEKPILKKPYKYEELLNQYRRIFNGTAKF